MNSLKRSIQTLALTIGLTAQLIPGSALADGLAGLGEGYVGDLQSVRLGVAAGVRTSAPGELQLRVGYRRILGAVDFSGGVALKPMEFVCADESDWLLTVRADGEWGVTQFDAAHARTSESFDLRGSLIALSRVDCTENNPIDTPTVSLQVAPFQLSRSLGAREKLVKLLSVVGVEGGLSTGSKHWYDQNEPDEKLRFFMRAAARLVGRKMKTLDARWDIDALELGHAELEGRLTYQVRDNCLAAASVFGSAGYSIGTTGNLHELGAGGRLAWECLVPQEETSLSGTDGLDAKKRRRRARAKAPRNILYIEGQRSSWGDEETQGGAETQLMGGFERRY